MKLLFRVVSAFLLVAGFASAGTGGIPAYDCKICPAGYEVTNFEGELVLPGQPTRTCQDLLDANEAGMIDEISCNLLTMLTPEFCGCELGDIVTVAKSAGTFNVLVLALEAANLVEALSEPMGPYTVFAPSDSAFEALPEGVVDALLIPENSEWLTQVLLYHVVPGAVLSTDLEDGMTVETLEGSSVNISISTETSSVMIDQAMVEAADIMASNGIIHAVNDVLLPPSFLESLPSILANLTVVDDPVVEEIVPTTRGAAPVLSDIPTTLEDFGTFEYLLAALNATGLTGALSEPEGPYTVFAPLDSAFEAFPPGIVSQLLTPPFAPILSSILLYHVVEGTYAAGDLFDGMNVTTLGGETVLISINEESGSVSANEAQVVTADIFASNGIIHAIAGVLLPPSFDLADLGM